MKSDRDNQPADWENRPPPRTVHSALYRVVITSPAMTTAMCVLYGFGVAILPLLALMPKHRPPPHWALEVLSVVFAPLMYTRILADAVNRWWKAGLYLAAAAVGWSAFAWYIPGDIWSTGRVQISTSLMLVGWGAVVYVRLARPELQRRATRSERRASLARQRAKVAASIRPPPVHEGAFNGQVTFWISLYDWDDFDRLKKYFRKRWGAKVIHENDDEIFNRECELKIGTEILWLYYGDYDGNYFRAVPQTPTGLALARRIAADLSSRIAR